MKGLARDWKRLAILVLAYAGAVCAALSGWFGGQAFEKMSDAGPVGLPEYDAACLLFWIAVGLGAVFAVIVWRIVPGGRDA
ncbi:hypothetical protein [Xanthobacter wiegelii]|uniref:hypothetical protein n=1 Tax=Xanthobacter wiegelii TaxID=3119913 RepID=UPI00372ACAF8